MSPSKEPPVLRLEDYRLLFNSIDEGFCVIEVLFNGGKPIDYRFLEVNEAFEQQTGLHGATGKRMREFAPHHEEHWFEIYGQIALTGQPERFTNEARELGRWYDVYAFRIGNPEKHRVAVLFHDISEEKRAEARQAFLLELNDILRPLSDPVQVQAEATRLLGKHLDVDRCYYVDQEGKELIVVAREYKRGDIPSVVGIYPLEVWPGAYLAVRSGQAVAIEDAQDSPVFSATEREAMKALALQSIAWFPVLKQGDRVAMLILGRIQTHAWTEYELSLLADVAERTWAAVERAKAEKAVHKSEARLRQATQAAGIYNWEVDPVAGTVSMSDNAAEVTAMLPTTLEEAWSGIHPDDVEDLKRAFFAAVENQEDFEAEYRIRVPESFGEVWAYSAGKIVPATTTSPLLVFGVTQSITSRKRNESTERVARQRAELMNHLMSELEGVEGVEGRARRLAEVLVPEHASFVSVELPGRRSTSRGQGKPHLRLPLPIGGKVSGRLSLAFGDESLLRDQLFESELAERVSLVLANARLQEEEHQVTQRLQRALLPESLAVRPEVALAARYHAGAKGLEVGGDWYDSFVLSDGRLGFVVGDVVGHGLEAAAAMGRMRTALNALASQSESPAEVIQQLDEFALASGIDFATACYAILDPETGDLSYSSAAHPAILLLRPDGTTRWLDEGRSVPLGSARGVERAEAGEVIEPGALLVFYSDGLIERRREPISMGMARLEAAVKEHRDLPMEELCDRLIGGLSVEGAHDDDTVVMCVQFVSLSGRTHFQSLAARPENLRQVREAIREWLEGRGVSHQQEYSLLLAVGEACSNAIRHAYRDRTDGNIELLIRQLDHMLFVRVKDSGGWKEEVDEEDRGWGTDLMKELSIDFTRETDDEGTVVTFRMPMAEEVRA